MSSTNNNGFIAAIVEQTGGSKSAILSNDAPTIVEKYQTPMKKADRFEEYKEGEMEMSDFAPIDSMDLPTVWLNTKQLPSAQGLVVGDKVYLMVEAEVANYSLNENAEGIKREEYTFKLKKGCIKKED